MFSNSPLTAVPKDHVAFPAPEVNCPGTITPTSAGTVRWESAKVARYYEATLQRNLFDEWEVLNVWGGIASPRGGHQCLPVEDVAAGLTLLAAIGCRREQRGYVPKPPFGVVPEYGAE